VSFFIRYAALSLAALIGLAGCATGPYQDIGSLPDYEDAVELDVVWDTAVGDGAEGSYLQLTPGITSEAIFAADAEGVVARLNREDGDIEWDIELELPLNGGVAADNAMVVVASLKGDVVALDPKTGDTLWKINLGRELLSVPALSWNRVFIQTGDGRIYALDRSDGAQKWLYNTDVPALTLRGTASPKLAGPVLVAGFASGRMAVIRQEDGRVFYERPVALPEGRSDLDRMIDVDGDIWIDEQLGVFTAYQGELMVLQLTNGKVIWSQPFSSTVGAVSGDGTVVAIDEMSHVWAFSQFYQSEQWTQKALEKRYLGTPAWLDGRVIVGDAEGYLHVLDGSTGALIGRKRLDSDPINARPIVDNSDIILQSVDGVVALVRVEAQE